MTGLRLVVVFLGALLCVSCVATVEEPKAEVAAEEGDDGDTKKDLDTAETKDFYYALKSKVDSLFKPFSNFKGSYQPSYRQYYSASPSYGYQYKFTPKYMQQIQDCYDNGQGYASSSGYYGGYVTPTPTKSYFIGGKPVYSSGSYGGGYNDQGYSSFGTSGSGYYGVPSKQYFIGGKPVSSGVSYDNGYSSQGNSFGATFSGSASIVGGAGYSPNNYNSGYKGFRPSKTYYSSSAYNPQTAGNAGYFSSNNPGYNTQNSYDSQVPVGVSGSGQGYYSSSGYPGSNYDSKTSVNPTPSYYFSNTYPQLQQPQYVQSTLPLQQPINSPPATYPQVQQPQYLQSTLPIQQPINSPPATYPQVQQPQYVQSTLPLQQPINSPPATFNSQSFVYVSTPKNVDFSTETPPASFSIAIVVPPGGPSSEISSNGQGVNPISQPTTTSGQPSTTASPLPEYSSTAIPITPRPQYNIQSTQNPITDGNRQSGYSIYSSDSYISRPYAYSPAFLYGYPASAPGVLPSSPQSNGVYLVQNYPVSGAGNYPFASPGVYPGLSSSVGVANGYEDVTQGSVIAFPTPTPVTPHVHCN